jgi:hypothetical protein
VASDFAEQTSTNIRIELSPNPIAIDRNNNNHSNQPNSLPAAGILRYTSGSLKDERDFLSKRDTKSNNPSKRMTKSE